MTKNNFLINQTNKLLRQLCKMLAIPRKGNREKLINNIVMSNCTLNDINDKLTAFNFCRCLSYIQKKQIRNMLGLHHQNLGEKMICCIP